ncbi:HAMP domain-containing protein [Thermodesulfobacteriota bacterium]
MAFGILILFGLSYWVGTYFSRAINHLRNATKRVNQGDFNIQVEPAMSRDMGELIEDFNRMVSQLAETTVRKEQLEISEDRLKNANAQLRGEISERERAEEALRESEERFRSIVENSHDGIAIRVWAFRRTIWKEFLNLFTQKKLWEGPEPDWVWPLYGEP